MKNTELFDTILGNRDKGERKSFERISNEFSEKIGEFNPTKNHVKISEYFGDKLGNDDEEMYLFEVYCSLHFDTKLNKFTTT